MNTTIATGKRKGGFASSLLKGALCTFLIGAALMIGAALIALCFPDPATVVRPFGYLALVACTFFGGAITARLTRGAFLSGLLSGGILAAVLFILSLILRIESILPFPFPLFFFIAVVFIAGLGGLMGKRKRPRRRRLHRAHRGA